MGIAAAAQGENVDPAKLIEGSELTLKMLGNALEKFGVTEVNPLGQRFDPQFHEAMSIQPRADVEPNTVVTVIQKGYLLNDRLIRPAMVIVAKAAPGGDAGSAAGGGIDERA
jgi:molecular chaperone GrpE